MGNDVYFMSSGWGFDHDGVDRRGWKAVSDSARRNLEHAKDEFRTFVKQTSFHGIEDEDFAYTKKQAIKLHLVGKLRPEFNRYVKTFGAKPKWNKLTFLQKKQSSKYKHRSSAIYFCDLTIDCTVRHKLYEVEPDAFSKELLLTEIALFTRLIHIGIPEHDALGWIVDIPKSQKTEKIPKIQDVQKFLDVKTKELHGNTVYVKDTNEYKAAPKTKKKKKKPKKKKTPQKSPDQRFREYMEKHSKQHGITTNNRNTIKRTTSAVSRPQRTTASTNTASSKTPAASKGTTRRGFFGVYTIYS
eukprot:44103_1